MNKEMKMLIKEAVLEALVEFTNPGVAVMSEGDVTGEEGDGEGDTGDNGDGGNTGGVAVLDASHLILKF